VRLEAEYAFNKGKKIIALRLEDGYVPDGWLGPLVINNLHYNFSKPDRFNTEFSKLLTVLQNLRPSPRNKGFCCYVIFHTSRGGQSSHAPSPNPANAYTVVN